MENDRTIHHWEVIKNGIRVLDSTPEALWERAKEYFKWTDEHPIITKGNKLSGKDMGGVYSIEQPRPYSLKALCIHCGVTEKWFRDVRDTKTQESEMFNIISLIMYIIYVQNAEYASTGIFNPIFTSRLLNLDKGEETVNQSIRVEVVNGLPQLARSENEVLEKLELENRVLDIND